MSDSDFIVEPWKFSIPTALVPKPKQKAPEEISLSASKINVLTPKTPPEEITLPAPDPITKAIESRTDSLVIERLLRKKGFSVSRLTEKLTLAAGVAQRQTNKIEARADAIIARETEIEKKTDEAFLPHEAILSEAEKGLDAVEAALKLMSNGGDPLPASGS